MRNGGGGTSSSNQVNTVIAENKGNKLWMLPHTLALFKLSFKHVNYDGLHNKINDFA